MLRASPATKLPPVPVWQEEKPCGAAKLARGPALPAGSPKPALGVEGQAGEQPPPEKRPRAEGAEAGAGAVEPGKAAEGQGPEKRPRVAGGGLDAAVPRKSDVARPTLSDLKTVIVNLERRPDRLEGCAERLRQHCPDLTWTRFAATDGKQVCIPASEVVSSWNTARNCVYQRLRSKRKGWNDLDSYKEIQLELSPGERGCASSHIRAWRQCLELAEAHGPGSERPLLVLEDDAAPTAEFQGVLTRALAVLPADAHLLYLGYSQAADWRCEISPDVVESEYVWTTVGYVIWPAGARILLERLPVDQPVDNWLAGLNAAGDLKAYCTRPKIVRQAEPWNVNSDVAHSDEHYWGTDSDIRHSDSFYWGPAPTTQAAMTAVGAGLAPGGLLRVPPPVLGSLAGGSLWEVGSDMSEDTESELDELALEMM